MYFLIRILKGFYKLKRGNLYTMKGYVVLVLTKVY